MDIEERQQKIAQLIQSKKRVKALALSQMFDVSVETIAKTYSTCRNKGARAGTGKGPDPSVETEGKPACTNVDVR
ncbi:MAG: DeoR family transcriptional regulator [Tessaracoccus sp.]